MRTGGKNEWNVLTVILYYIIYFKIKYAEELDFPNGNYKVWSGGPFQSQKVIVIRQY